MKKIIIAAFAAILGIGLMGCADAVQTSHEQTHTRASQVSEANDSEDGQNPRADEETRGGKEMREFKNEDSEFNGERPELPDDFDGDMREFGGRGMKDFDGELPEDFDGEMSESGGRGGRGMRDFNGELPADFDGDMPQHGSNNASDQNITGERKSKSDSANSASDQSITGERKSKSASDQNAAGERKSKSDSVNSASEQDKSAASGGETTRKQLPSGSNQSSTGAQKSGNSSNVRPDATTTGAAEQAQ